MKIGFLLLMCCGLIVADTDAKTDAKTTDGKDAPDVVEVKLYIQIK